MLSLLTSRLYLRFGRLVPAVVTSFQAPVLQSMHPAQVTLCDKIALGLSVKSLHTTTASQKGAWFKEPQLWKKDNDVVYPPTEEGQIQRPAEVAHHFSNVRCATKKLFYLSIMIRGMSVDEARKQLMFYNKKAAALYKELIDEVVELAVRDHNVEYRSNLWISDAYVTKAHTIKGVRRHARSRMGTIHYRYSHLFIRLREGRPPKNFYPPLPDGNQKLQEYMRDWRNKTIVRAL